MKKVAFYTLGCKVNQYETEAMSELFLNAGYELADYDSFADIYVINTCTVTGMSDRKSRQIIRRAKKYNPNAFVIVAGCYSQVSPDEVLKIEGVNLVLGTKDRSNIVQLYEQNRELCGISCVDDIMQVHSFDSLFVSTYSDRTRAYIKVQEGCNQFCSYCKIPYARGPIRSRDFREVMEESQRLADSGFTEITYVGIHIASYGLDTKSEDLADLLNSANAIRGIKRIRLSSIEPMTLDEAFIRKIKDCDKLCRHFHLSLQSGCDETLRRMNRKYTTDDYYKIVQGLRQHFPDVAITTDIMVGFPGETDEEFEKTCAFAEKVAFSGAHIFQYSPREGTPAADFPNQVDPQVKEKRSKLISKICNRTKQEFMERFIGQAAEVLFEQAAGDGYFEGKTDNYQSVLVKTDEDLSGEYRMVRLDRIKNGAFVGEIVTEDDGNYLHSNNHS
ncbi:MAG: tRNA (N(6)-L-threonylcarbamoyladenosine(37)-C(2))-methylthiotransferase MtaB [Clostridia bacterium]|nr:tRNA (N(6)-L-threonylcarbamoyladenosine(37)-C(2))-methylthiotransferase MtaB [Clostridia bacterium]